MGWIILKGKKIVLKRKQQLKLPKIEYKHNESPWSDIFTVIPNINLPVSYHIFWLKWFLPYLFICKMNIITQFTTYYRFILTCYENSHGYVSLTMVPSNSMLFLVVVLYVSPEFIMTGNLSSGLYPATILLCVCGSEANLISQQYQW
jgi:hypothetical protein